MTYNNNNKDKNQQAWVDILTMVGRVATHGYGDTCPLCKGKYTGQCRCKLGERTCANNHSWFMCPKHQCLVIGVPDHARGDEQCQCDIGYQYLIKNIGERVFND